MASTVVDSPIGPLGLVATRDGLAGVQFHAHSFPSEGASPILDDAEEQLASYFAGELIGVRPAARPRRKRVPAPLLARARDDPVRPDRQLRRAGAPARLRPEKARAVGAANGQNPLPLVLPCHRVIGADGSLTGFGGGLPMKRFLLEHEGALLPLG